MPTVCQAEDASKKILDSDLREEFILMIEVKTMTYKIHEIAELSGVTIKTLYHYQKIGLLKPEKVEKNGYRMYGQTELKRLQQILFYREMGFPLESIKAALDSEPNRLLCLEEQHSQLKAKEQRLFGMLNTLEETMRYEKEGVPMKEEKLFTGLNKKEWEEALAEQNRHLQEKYSYQINTKVIDAAATNEKAREASDFMSFMAASLKNGVSAADMRVYDAIERHIKLLRMDMNVDAQSFAEQTKFFVTDDFHRIMLEDQQTGLSYYLHYAAECHATNHNRMQVQKEQ
jgi:DNA-binding transcriptional MerR regulator